LPRSTILGPITGSFVSKKKNASFLRKIIMPIFFQVSYKIIKIRFNLLLQALDNFNKLKDQDGNFNNFKDYPRKSLIIDMEKIDNIRRLIAKSYKISNTWM
jgi:hypothetical protein